MSNFNPTHEFRGLELEFQDDDPCVYGLTPFRDEDNNYYYIPDDVVSKIQPKPQPGEVWKYIETLAESHEYRLEVVTRRGYFRDLDGDVTPYEGNERYYKKVLNADGSPA